jgi:hypothetical protein
MTIMPNAYTPTDLLEYALIGLEHRKAELTHAIARLRSSLQGSVSATATNSKNHASQRHRV